MSDTTEQTTFNITLNAPADSDRELDGMQLEDVVAFVTEFGAKNTIIVQFADRTPSTTETFSAIGLTVARATQP